MTVPTKLDATFRGETSVEARWAARDWASAEPQIRMMRIRETLPVEVDGHRTTLWLVSMSIWWLHPADTLGL